VPSPNPGGIANLNYLTGAAAISPASAWAVGQTGTLTAPQTLILHWNGTTWTRVASPNPGGPGEANNLQGVAAVSASDAWAVGYCFSRNSTGRTMILHWNGRIWKRMPSPNASGLSALNSVTAISRTNAWAAGWNNTGHGWRTLILHWNGRAWRLVSSPNPNDLPVLNGVAARSRSNAWAAGFYYASGYAQTLTERWNGRTWKLVRSPDPAGPTNDTILQGIAVAGRDLAWAFGYYTNSARIPGQDTLILRWNGKTWSQTPTPSPGGASNFNGINGLAVLSPSSAWAVGQYYDGTTNHTLTLRWNGATWQKVPSP
jgi:hypothetical protein